MMVGLTPSGLANQTSSSVFPMVSTTSTPGWAGRDGGTALKRPDPSQRSWLARTSRASHRASVRRYSRVGADRRSVGEYSRVGVIGAVWRRNSRVKSGPSRLPSPA